jgi:hypothetical protein
LRLSPIGHWATCEKITAGKNNSTRIIRLTWCEVIPI